MTLSFVFFFDLEKIPIWRKYHLYICTYTLICYWTTRRRSLLQIEGNCIRCHECFDELVLILWQAIRECCGVLNCVDNDPLMALLGLSLSSLNSDFNDTFEPASVMLDMSTTTTTFDTRLSNFDINPSNMPFGPCNLLRQNWTFPNEEIVTFITTYNPYYFTNRPWIIGYTATWARNSTPHSSINGQKRDTQIKLYFER